MNESLTKIYNSSPKIIQTIGINIVELKQLQIRKSKQFNEWLQFLKITESWKEDEFIRYQNKHLENMVMYADKYVPFYHQLYKKNNIDLSKIKTINDLEQLPIVTKEDIINNWNSFISTKKEKFIIRHTSGTTGKPLTLRLSYDLDILDKANWTRRDLWGGYDNGWIARFVGDSPVKDSMRYPLYRKSYVLKRAIFPTYYLSLDTLPMIFNDLKKLNIEYIQCYPSAGYLLAKYLEMNNDFFPLKALFYSSEPLFPFQRKIIEERFKTKLFGFYGQAEEVVSALECERGGYHLTMIDGILEILNDGKPVSNGEKGYTVVTSLHNFSMPLIRYELNDYTGYKVEKCDCKRTSPLIHPIESRLGDFIITPAGLIISPTFFTFPLKHAQHILESQIVQKTIDTLIIRIVRTDNYTNSDEDRLLESLKQILGEDMNIKIEYVKKIHETKNFKKRFVINEIGKDYFEKAFDKLQ